MVLCWEWSLPAASAFWLFYTFVTAAFFSSTLEKVPTGAWFRYGTAAERRACRHGDGGWAMVGGGLRQQRQVQTRPTRRRAECQS